ASTRPIIAGTIALPDCAAISSPADAAAPQAAPAPASSFALKRPALSGEPKPAAASASSDDDWETF
ncbi:hypothetical protein, partial [Burkholderia pseudomallei]|uniref:hypothetical protein n=1 Tax=Burkholderia pseudomallei TaxID=28450 RepID=UPI002930EAA5